jgi:predicted Rossmann fold flavoprotein
LGIQNCKGAATMKEFDVIVVGAGAAGLMAAGQAAAAGAKTLLLEKMDQPGRKIFITGKFRCNLTNTAPIPEFIDHFGKNGRFLRQAFHRYFSEDLLAFFQTQGVPTIIERGGRVFPKSGQSKDVVQALERWCRSQKVNLKTYAPVDSLVIQDGKIQGVRTPDQEYRAKAVIVTTGGASYPGTGSTGDGYKLARDAAHTIISVHPALVPLVTTGDIAQRLQGLSLRNVAVTLWLNGKKVDQKFGEMLFTHFGVSGPIILTLSRTAVRGLRANQKVALSIDLKSALDELKLDTRLVRDLNANGKKQFHTFLKGLLPQKMIPVCSDLVQISGDKLCHQINAKERKKLLHWLKNFQLEISDHRSFRHAIVTAGGVNTKEISPKTMESKLVAGLYFAGEVLDVDADTGGFNLQAAFSTGWLAGKSAAEKAR